MSRTLDGQTTALARPQHEASGAASTGFEERRTSTTPSRVPLRHKLVVVALVALIVVWALALAAFGIRLVIRL